MNKKCESQTGRKGLSTHWFDLGSVQFSPVEHDGMDGVPCSGSLDRGGEHVQEILGDKKGDLERV